MDRRDFLTTSAAALAFAAAPSFAAQFADMRKRVGLIATERSIQFQGLCSLCGEPCARAARYCRAHEWAT